jgi:HEPN domain-containing protein
MDVEKAVQYWLTTATDDLIAAEHLFQSGDYTHALFFAHLYLEKVLKAQMELQFKRQCTQEFCAEELKEIKEFGAWIEKMVTS